MESSPAAVAQKWIFKVKIGQVQERINVRKLLQDKYQSFHVKVSWGRNIFFQIEAAKKWIVLQ